MMAIVFWDGKGVLLVGFMERATKITPDVYRESLTKLKRAIQNRWRGKLWFGIVLLHNNAFPHTTNRTKKIQDSDWKVFDYTLYSPDLASSDYYLFLHLKHVSVDNGLKSTGNLRPPLTRSNPRQQTSMEKN
ncbi:hypothetical protein Trydic_g20876 [Trypoxylus dichotomus]